MWDGIAITCRFKENVEHLNEEFLRLQRQGVLPAASPILAIEDPADGLGSGGSTLNAVLVLAEHLSALRGDSVLHPDVLRRRRFLVLHTGGPYRLEPLGRVFRRTGRLRTTPAGFAVEEIHIGRLVYELGRILGDDAPFGVWICGSDASFKIADGFRVDWTTLANDDLAAFSIPIQSQHAASHGIYEANKDGILDDIHYRTTDPAILSRCRVSSKGEEVPLVMALVWMSERVSESVLGLHTRQPLSASTYLGIDGGSVGFKLSLFFDFLQPTCRRVEKADFVAAASFGMDGHCEDRKEFTELLRQARGCLWDAMHRYKTRLVMLDAISYDYHFAEKVESLLAVPDSEDWQSGLGSKGNSLPLMSAESVRGQAIQKNDKFLITIDGTADPQPFSWNKVWPLLDHQKLHANRRHDFLLHGIGVMVEAISKQQDTCLLPFIQSICDDGNHRPLLTALDDAAIRSGPNEIGRVLGCVSDVLGTLAAGRGGLRSGPAAHHDWRRPFQLLEDGSQEQGIRALSHLRDDWMSGLVPSKLIRAARHYEAAAQIYTRRLVLKAQELLQLSPMAVRGSPLDWATVHAPVRMDLAGGWSDTPPITQQHGGAVLNLALKVDGKLPVRVDCRGIPEPELRIRLEGEGSSVQLTLTRLEEVARYSNPSAPGSLVCAVLVCAKLVDPRKAAPLDQQITAGLGAGPKFRGLEIQASSTLPQGSGMGTSSILAGALLGAVWRTMGLAFSSETLLHAVLVTEQLLTTGGGWQDQVGGLTPGLKIARLAKGASRVAVEKIPVSPGELRDLSSRLLLVYTGRTRLAKNLLQEVVRNWLSRGPAIVATVGALVDTAEEAALELKDPTRKQGDWSCLATAAKRYWAQKQQMAPGCEPMAVRLLLAELRSSGTAEAGWMAGAGGGGFLFLLLAKGKGKTHVDAVLGLNPEFVGMTTHTAEVVDEDII